MLLVDGLFDQEDIYGGPALFKALAPKDPKGDLIHLVLGPWNHGQGRREGRGIGAIMFAGDTVEFGATPYCGDAHFTDWPGTLDAIRAFKPEKLVPGRGRSLTNPHEVEEVLGKEDAAFFD